jgi:hypothetical protein
VVEASPVLLDALLNVLVLGHRAKKKMQHTQRTLLKCWKSSELYLFIYIMCVVMPWFVLALNGLSGFTGALVVLIAKTKTKYNLLRNLPIT